MIISHLSQFVPSLSVLKDVQILVVDNDSDSRYLCSILFESYGAKVTTIESIADALTLLDWFIPDILICEIKFSDETVVSLIQRVRAIGLGCDRIIPILIASAYCPTSLPQDLNTTVEAYLIKPIDIDCFVSEVWNLLHLPIAIKNTSIKSRFCKHEEWTRQYFFEVARARLQVLLLL